MNTLLTPEEKAEAKETKKEEHELSIEEKYEQLNKDFNSYKQQQEGEKQREQLNQALTTEIGKYDLVKERPQLLDGIKHQALAAQQLNPKKTIQEHIMDAVKERQELITVQKAKKEEMEINTKTVKNSMKGGFFGMGGTPTIELPEKTTPDDVKSGKTEGMMADLLRQLSAGG